MKRERLDKSIAKKDPLKINAEKGLEETEHSPMSPPGAYEELDGTPEYDFEDFAPALQLLINEHKMAKEIIGDFENALIIFKANLYKHDSYTNGAFTAFFEYFDNSVMKHNEKEEKCLFPLLHQRLIESGEHSHQAVPVTAIDMMEDDHIKFIQLGSLAFNLFGLAVRLFDTKSQLFTFDVAYTNAIELIELLKLHIYREDNRLFPLAQKLLTAEELETIHQNMCTSYPVKSCH